MKRILLFLILAYIHQIGLVAQVPENSKEAQTLWQEIQKMENSKVKVDKLIDLGIYFQNVNIDSSIIINEKALEVAESIDYQEGIIKYASNQSYMYNLLGEFQKGLEINQKSHETALKLNDKAKQLSALANMGISYSYLNDYDQAIRHYQMALDIAIETKDNLRSAKIYGIISGTYNNMGQSSIMDSVLFEKAIHFGKQALTISRTLKDSVLLSDNLITLALAYNNLERLDDAFPFASEAETISKSIGLSQNYAHALSILAKIARNKKQYDEAINLATEAASIQKQMGSDMGLAIVLKELALCYQYKGDNKQALEVINEAITIAESQEMSYILDGMYINKADYLYELKSYKEAYDFLDKGHTLSDSIRGLEIKTQINELEKKYETAKKEQNILQLTTKQKLNNWIIIGLILILFAISIIGLIWRKNLKYKTKLIEQEKEKLQNEKQIQATASIIKGQEDERHRLAKDLHDGLGGMLSGLKYTLNNMGDNMVLSGRSVDSFNNALSMLDQAIVEMRKVAHNMMPESLLKFGIDETLKDYISKMNASNPMKIHYQAYNYERLDQSLEINLYRIIQEVINNAVKYAKASDMYIQMDYQDDHLHLTIEDNGIGFDTTVENSKSGIGLKNIADRVSYMNGKLEMSSSPGKGTLFVIEIKTPKS